MKRKLVPLMLLCLWLVSSGARAADKEETGGDNATYEMGFNIGTLLPNQIDGVTEIMGLGGVSGGFRFAPLTYLEGGLIAGNGNGVNWKDAHADIRIDIPIEHLVGIAYVGADTIYYTGNDNSDHLIFGGHLGGGIQAALSGQLWFRSDMKFSFSPGTSLYVGFGLVLRTAGG